MNNVHARYLHVRDGYRRLINDVERASGLLQRDQPGWEALALDAGNQAWQLGMLDEDVVRLTVEQRSELAQLARSFQQTMVAFHECTGVWREEKKAELLALQRQRKVLNVYKT